MDETDVKQRANIQTNDGCDNAAAEGAASKKPARNNNNKRKASTGGGAAAATRRSTRRRASTNNSSPSDAPESADEEPKQPSAVVTVKYTVGTKVAKTQARHGMVTKFDESKRLYRVAYFDGTGEDLDEDKVKELVRAADEMKDKKAEEEAAAQRKREEEAAARNEAVAEGGGSGSGGGSDNDNDAADSGNDAAENNNDDEETEYEPFDHTLYQHSGPPDDIDERDKDDPVCASAYAASHYAAFSAREAAQSTRNVYMDDQPFINERMRAILVDWLIEVHLKFKLVPETLHLTVNIIDRYLNICEVSRPKLQLVGVTALSIASKFEEIFPPELRDLVYICDRAYAREEILEMETKMLRKLDYRINVPTAHAFLVRYLKAAHADKHIVQLACCVLDSTLLNYGLLQYLPSQLAAASVLIARRTAGRNAWSPTLLHMAGRKHEEVVPVAQAVLKARGEMNANLKALGKKYCHSRYGNVGDEELSDDFVN